MCELVKSFNNSGHIKPKMYKPEQKEKGMLLVPFRYAIEMGMVIKCCCFMNMCLLKTRNNLKQIKKTNKNLILQTQKAPCPKTGMPYS